jgi:hypothetical protein
MMRGNHMDDTGVTTEPLDLLSEDFADFALDEMERNRRTTAAFTVEGQDFFGKLLGFGSSYSTNGTHTGHMPGNAPAPGVRCAACRWADVAIMRVESDDNVPLYLVATMGKSDVGGEDQRIKTVWTPSAFEVLSALPVAGRDGRSTKIPFPNATAFRYAAHVDPAIKSVLDEHEGAIPSYDDNPSRMTF